MKQILNTSYLYLFAEKYIFFLTILILSFWFIFGISKQTLNVKNCADERLLCIILIKLSFVREYNKK